MHKSCITRSHSLECTVTILGDDNGMERVTPGVDIWISLVCDRLYLVWARVLDLTEKQQRMAQQQQSEQPPTLYSVQHCTVYTLFLGLIKTNYLLLHTMHHIYTATGETESAHPSRYLLICLFPSLAILQQTYRNKLYKRTLYQFYSSQHIK